MTWWRHIITARDNSTVSIGRVLGLIVFGLFIVALPIASMVTTFKGWVPASEWGLLYDKLGVYLPAVILSIGGLIFAAGTTDPRGPRPPRDPGNP